MQFLQSLREWLFSLLIDIMFSKCWFQMISSFPFILYRVQSLHPPRNLLQLMHQLNISIRNDRRILFLLFPLRFLMFSLTLRLALPNIKKQFPIAWFLLLDIDKQSAILTKNILQRTTFELVATKMHFVKHVLSILSLLWMRKNYIGLGSNKRSARGMSGLYGLLYEVCVQNAFIIYW